MKTAELLTSRTSIKLSASQDKRRSCHFCSKACSVTVESYKHWRDLITGQHTRQKGTSFDKHMRLAFLNSFWHFTHIITRHAHHNLIKMQTFPMSKTTTKHNVMSNIHVPVQ